MASGIALVFNYLGRRFLVFPEWRLAPGYPPESANQN